MDPHDKEELEKSNQTAEAAADKVPEGERPEGGLEPMDAIILSEENSLISLLSTARTYALTRRNGGLLPKDMCKEVSDVVDEAFDKGLVAFAKVEHQGVKHKGLVLTEKGYKALATDEA